MAIPAGIVNVSFQIVSARFHQAPAYYVQRTGAEPSFRCGTGGGGGGGCGCVCVGGGGGMRSCVALSLGVIR